MAETKYTVKPTSRFKKDLRRINKQGLDLDELEKVVLELANGEMLDPVYRDHELTGDFKGCRECHIHPDWLLIYEVDGDTLFLYLTRTGSHSDLFSK